MRKISEPFFFCDFDEDLHRTMVFGLAEPGRSSSSFSYSPYSQSSTTLIPVGSPDPLALGEAPSFDDGFGLNATLGALLTTGFGLDLTVVLVLIDC